MEESQPGTASVPGRPKVRKAQGFTGLLPLAVVGAVALAIGFGVWWMFFRESYSDSEGNRLGVFSSDDLVGKVRACKSISGGAQVCTSGHQLVLTEDLKPDMRCALMSRELPHGMGTVDLYGCGASRADVQLALSAAEDDYLDYMWSSQLIPPPEGENSTRCYTAGLCGGKFANCAEVECDRRNKKHGTWHGSCGDGKWYLTCR